MAQDLRGGGSVSQLISPSPLHRTPTRRTLHAYHSTTPLPGARRVSHAQASRRNGGNTMANISKSERIPKPMQATFDAIVALTDAFCRAHLDEEYAQLARQATAALCRKRPSPLATGTPEDVGVWDCLCPRISQFSLR